VIFAYQVAEEVGKVEGVKKVLLAENDVFKGLLPGLLDFFYYFLYVAFCDRMNLL